MIQFNYLERKDSGICFSIVDLNETDIVGISILNEKLYTKKGLFKKFFKKIHIQTAGKEYYIGCYNASVWEELKPIIRGWNKRKDTFVEAKKHSYKKATNWYYFKSVE